MRATAGARSMNFAPAPDGKRILALMPVETAEAQMAQNQVIFLENFADELRHLRSANRSLALADLRRRESAIFFRLVELKKATHCPSGEKKGADAPCAPGSSVVLG
jgi:hypothetical protein